MIEEIEVGRTHAAAATMLELRPHLDTAERFIELVDGVQRPQGYRLAGVFDSDGDGGGDGGDAVSVAGFRQLDSLSWGKHVYIDDLVTRETHRGRGHAKALLDWVADEARRLGCAVVHLDSATHRHVAHRRYLTAEYRINAFHFVRDL